MLKTAFGVVVGALHAASSCTHLCVLQCSTEGKTGLVHSHHHHHKIVPMSKNLVASYFGYCGVDDVEFVEVHHAVHTS